ncbi:hypothetical protein CPSG_05589 [Coccidioides posadasii str. Silveira]|uniref:Uncharacterized protein n=1 Tax=Coccidioides posadasii (strain RMSCC 757 / Silveira) TaxID=443226 RepID=E9D6T0_COCPS|nr:hypothetical protein CPSG_05589 [Coccidioides posadasii str. Silveira]
MDGCTVYIPKGKESRRAGCLRHECNDGDLTTHYSAEEKCPSSAQIVTGAVESVSFVLSPPAEVEVAVTLFLQTSLSLSV